MRWIVIWQKILHGPNGPIVPVPVGCVEMYHWGHKTQPLKTGRSIDRITPQSCQNLTLGNPDCRSGRLIICQCLLLHIYIFTTLEMKINKSVFGFERTLKISPLTSLPPSSANCVTLDMATFRSFLKISVFWGATNDAQRPANYALLDFIHW